MRKSVVLAFGSLLGSWMLFIAGCGSDDKAPGIPVGPKWKGEPYRISFDTQAPKPNPSGVTIPAIKYTANPEALENRVSLVVRFDASGPAGKAPVANRMIEAPVDIKGADGTLPADYIDRTSKGLSTFLGAYCVKGKVNASVALARSSLSQQAGDNEVDAKRLSDWLPIELTFKNPHPKC